MSTASLLVFLLALAATGLAVKLEIRRRRRRRIAAFVNSLPVVRRHRV